MADLATIPETIQYADISIGLACNDRGKGAIFGGTTSPNAHKVIAIAADMLRYMYDGDPTDTRLRALANYVLWLIRMYSAQAQNLIAGGGGGTVVPGGGSAATSLFPMYVTSADFTSATFYPNTDIFGNNIIIFLNEINRYLLPGSEFTVDATGVTITLSGFDATSFTYNLVIEKYNN